MILNLIILVMIKLEYPVSMGKENVILIIKIQNNISFHINSNLKLITELIQPLLYSQLIPIMSNKQNIGE